MTLDKVDKAFVTFWGVMATLILAFWISVAVIAIHFLSKVW